MTAYDANGFHAEPKFAAKSCLQWARRHQAKTHIRPTSVNCYFISLLTLKRRSLTAFSVFAVQTDNTTTQTASRVKQSCTVCATRHLRQALD